jgi:hypothetical protein
VTSSRAVRIRIAEVSNLEPGGQVADGRVTRLCQVYCSTKISPLCEPVATQ